MFRKRKLQMAGVAAGPAVAIDWSLTAMTESAARLGAPSAWELPRLAAAVAETVWWSRWPTRHRSATIRDYEKALASFIRPAADDAASWVWGLMPEPGLGRHAPQSRQGN